MRNRNLGIILVIILLLIIAGVWYYNVIGFTGRSNIFGNLGTSTNPLNAGYNPPVAATSTSQSGFTVVTSGSSGGPAYSNTFGNTGIIPRSKINSQVVISLADNTRQIHVPYGSSILLGLGEIDWSVSVSDPDIIRRVPNIAVIRGAQGIYETERIGVTTISAEGRPICSPDQICAQYIIDFYVTIVVDP